jgi:hypothetical protein
MNTVQIDNTVPQLQAQERHVLYESRCVVTIFTVALIGRTREPVGVGHSDPSCRAATQHIQAREHLVLHDLVMHTSESQELMREECEIGTIMDYALTHWHCHGYGFQGQPVNRGGTEPGSLKLKGEPNTIGRLDPRKIELVYLVGCRSTLSNSIYEVAPYLLKYNKVVDRNQLF